MSELIFTVGLVAVVFIIVGSAAILYGSRQEDTPLPPPKSDERSSIETFRRIHER